MTKEDDSMPGKAIIPDAVDNPSQNTTKRGKGRPRVNVILDKPVVLNFITYLLKKDTSDAEIARLVGVAPQSFNNWKKKNIHLWDEAQEYYNNPMRKVERALLDRATGGFIERPIYDKQGNLKGTKYQYYPPSDTAIQYYLNNRDPANWKSKVEHNHAIEELPLSINFVRGPAPKEEDEVAKIDGNGNQGIS